MVTRFERHNKRVRLVRSTLHLEKAQKHCLRVLATRLLMGCDGNDFPVHIQSGSTDGGVGCRSPVEALGFFEGLGKSRSNGIR
jgi:hypothetical protein